MRTMTRDEAIKKYAETMIGYELEHYEKFQPERLKALSEEQITEWKQRMHASANKLADEIDAKHPDIVKRLCQGMVNPHNKTTRKLFVAITGIQLPVTSGGTEAALMASEWGPLMQAYWDEVQRRSDEEAARKKAEREAKELKAVLAALDLVRANEPVSGDSLVDVSRFLGIELHPRTIGTLRKRIGSIKDGQCRVYGRRVPDGVWAAYKTVKIAADSYNPVAIPA